MAGDWTCSHDHRTEQAARVCRARRCLFEVDELIRQNGEVDLTNVDAETRQMGAEQAAQFAEMRAEALAQIRAAELS